MPEPPAATPFKQPRQSWFWWLMMVLPSLYLSAILTDLWWYFSNPDRYPIGWEGGGWTYRSHRNYVVSGILWMLPPLLCLCGFLFGRSLITGRLVKLAASVMTVVMLPAIPEAIRLTIQEFF